MARATLNSPMSQRGDSRTTLGIDRTRFSQPSEKALRYRPIIVELHSSAQFGMTSNLNSTTTYDVVCHAASPVLTANCALGYGHIGAKASQITTPLLSDTDLVRIRGLGVNSGSWLAVNQMRDRCEEE